MLFKTTLVTSLWLSQLLSYSTQTYLLCKQLWHPCTEEDSSHNFTFSHLCFFNHIFYLFCFVLFSQHFHSHWAKAVHSIPGLISLDSLLNHQAVTNTSLVFLSDVSTAPPQLDFYINISASKPDAHGLCIFSPLWAGQSWHLADGDCKFGECTGYLYMYK